MIQASPTGLLLLGAGAGHWSLLISSSKVKKGRNTLAVREPILTSERRAAATLRQMRSGKLALVSTQAEWENLSNLLSLANLALDSSPGQELRQGWA